MDILYDSPTFSCSLHVAEVPCVAALPLGSQSHKPWGLLQRSLLIPSLCCARCSGCSGRANGEVFESTKARGKPIVYLFGSRPFTGGICAGEQAACHGFLDWLVITLKPCQATSGSPCMFLPQCWVQKDRLHSILTLQRYTTSTIILCGLLSRTWAVWDFKKAYLPADRRAVAFQHHGGVSRALRSQNLSVIVAQAT